MLLNPGVRISTSQYYLVYVKDRAGGDYTLIFGAYMAQQKINFNTGDPAATGGLSVSFATLASGSNAGSNAKSVFSVDTPAVMSTSSPVAENNVEVFEVESGFVFSWGTRPKIKSRRVYLGGDGTKVLAYVEPGTFPTVEHFFLVDPINSDAARLYKLDANGQPGSTPDVTLSSSLRYAKFTTGGEFQTSATIPSDVQNVLDFARQQALAVGY